MFEHPHRVFPNPKEQKPFFKFRVGIWLLYINFVLLTNESPKISLHLTVVHVMNAVYHVSNKLKKKRRNTRMQLCLAAYIFSCEFIFTMHLITMHDDKEISPIDLNCTCPQVNVYRILRLKTAVISTQRAQSYPTFQGWWSHATGADSVS